MKFTVAPAAALLLMLSIVCPMARAGEKTEIRVRLLDAHSGKPYVNRELALFGSNSSSGMLYATDTLFELHAKTGVDGVAHFELESPLPKTLLIYSYQAGVCARSGSFVTEEVVHNGIVTANTCAGKHQKYRWQDITAQPGEIVSFAVPPRGP